MLIELSIEYQLPIEYNRVVVEVELKHGIA
jgi:hypothetical protein